MFVVKLGGSVITDKSKQYHFQAKVMARLAKEIRNAEKNVLLIHGAGSFGHILAKKYQLNEGYKTEEQRKGFSLTQAKVQELNSLVLHALHQQGIPAVSLPPHAFLTLDNHRPADVNYSITDAYMKNGFTPVTFGDVALDKKLGFSICSGDLLVQLFAAYYKPKKVVFVIDEDGLYTSNPKKDRSARFIEDITVFDLEKLTTVANNHADVTEGMKGKVNTIKMVAQAGIDTVVVNGRKPNRLYKILTGEDTKCTYIHGEKK